MSAAVAGGFAGVLREPCGIFRISPDCSFIDPKRPSNRSVCGLGLQLDDPVDDPLSVLRQLAKLAEPERVDEGIDVAEVTTALPAVALQQPFEVASCVP